MSPRGTVLKSKIVGELKRERLGAMLVNTRRRNTKVTTRAKPAGPWPTNVQCECQVCSSKIHGGKQIEPAIKSATSSTIVCSGACVRAAQRAAAGGCPGCECPADGCPGTKCSCPICGPHEKPLAPTSCRDSDEARTRATTGNCPACGCPPGKCPCTGCICPVCKSL